MQIETYLEKYQPVVYKTFVNAINNNHLSHAYLLSGAPGMPLKEAALYLTKSLLCDERNPLACNNCITCLRIDEGNYTDVIIVDGEANKIKKSDVSRITTNFDKTALEEKGIMVYLIHLVEKMTPVAINALLKFLEEPGKNIYAFLTTENESKVLPTIISRSQVLRFKAIPRGDIIADALKEDVSREDAELLSFFYSDGKRIKEVLESDIYKSAKEALDEQLDALLLNRGEAIYTCQAHVIPLIKNGETARLYLKMLSLIFEDILTFKLGENIKLTTYSTIIESLSKRTKDVDRSLYVIMSSIEKIDLNVNLGLLLDHLIYEIS